MTAGLGTRLRPFTGIEPKPLLPLMGIPMAQFAIDTLAQAGVRRIVANVHHEPERARAGLAALDLSGAELAFSDESAELLGSAGGIRHALPLLGDEPFFLLNADVLCDIDLGALARRHRRLRRERGVTMTLALFPKGPPPGKYAELVFDGSLVTEWRPPTMERPFYVGAAVFEPEAFARLPDAKASEFVPEVLKPAIAAGKAGGYLTTGIWHDIGDPTLWARAHFELMRRLETAGLPGKWKARIEAANKRLAPQVWVSRSASRFLRSSEWSGPSYYHPWGVKTRPAALGPRSVLYGLDTGRPSADLISYAGLTAPVG